MCFAQERSCVAVAPAAMSMSLWHILGLQSEYVNVERVVQFEPAANAEFEAADAAANAEFEASTTAGGSRRAMSP